MASTALAAAPDPPPLRDLRWLASSADPVRSMTRRPAECLRHPADPRAAYLIELGRAAFRTPMILGGQAARIGVACETCHSSGRRNADFHFPGLSGRPGTADVTNAILSSHRDDGVFNPKPIPDLGGSKRSLKIDQSPGRPDLERFIHGLLTEEFDGPEPPAAVLEGLAAYVRALDPSACPAAIDTPLTAGAALDDARRAAAAAVLALGRGDRAAALVMIEAARSRLGVVDERFAGPRLEADRNRLAVASRSLAAAAAAVRAQDPASASRLETWLATLDRTMAPLLRDESSSLYDPMVLARAVRIWKRSPAP